MKKVIHFCMDIIVGVKCLAAKRAFDLFSTLAALLILGPAFLLLAVLVRLRLGSPVLFRQIRPGLEGKPFVMYKFRTMTEEKDDSGVLLPDKERLTSFGRFLRSTSLDELPELLNIVKGDMSLVGPRPLLMEYLERYSPKQARRHEVQPGLTGWAQVNGRNAISWEEKFAHDVWYVDNRTFWLDIKIILRTILQTIHRDGISQPGHATMPVFYGSEKNGD